MRATFLACLALSTPCLAQTCIYKVDGGGDRIGKQLANAGDVDGDGIDDLIAGQDQVDLFGSGSGAVRVYSGLDGALIYNVFWTEASGTFGRGVDGAGDVNGDGRADIIVGAPGSSLAGSASGTVVVYSGMDGIGLYQLTGNIDSSFGASVAGLGDLNQDGFSDFAVGAPGDDTQGNSAGRVVVYSGLDGTELANLYGNPGDNLGRVVDAAGDVDADGTPDLVVSAQRAAMGGMEGYVRVFSGADFSVLLTVTPPVLGVAGLFGRSAAGAGDVNNDGHADIVVGAPIVDANGADSGEVYLYSGDTGALIYSVAGETKSKLGTDLDDLGDVNGDGVADIIVGAVNAPEPGAPGKEPGAALVLSGLDGSTLLVLRGQDANENFGSAVAGLGDITGDGLPDFATGAPKAGQGLVEIWSSAENPAFYCVGAPNSVGPGVSISTTGSASVSDADQVLAGAGCPPGVFGLFFFGPGTGQVPFGDGFLCITGPLQRLPPAQADAGGLLSSDLWGHGVAEAWISAGSTWNFQLWYRDPFGPGGTGFNASNALSLTFCP
jgi:FG-GAP repeat